MIESDTIKLLRECDAGIKMGVSSIDEVMPHVKADELYNSLKNARTSMRSLKEKQPSFLKATRTRERTPTRWQRECLG